MRAFIPYQQLLYGDLPATAQLTLHLERESKDRRYSKGQLYPTVLELKLWIFEAQSRKREGRNAE
jgi:hypothetical protein